MRHFIILIFLLLFNVGAYASTTNAAEKYPIYNDLQKLYSTAQSYYEKQEWGPAMLYVLRAWSLSPLDPDIRQSADNIRQELNIAPVYYYQEPISRFLHNLFLIVPSNVQLFLGLTFLTLGSLFLTLILAGKTNVKLQERKYKFISLSLMALGLMFMVLTESRYRYLFDTHRAVVITELDLSTRPEANEERLAAISPGMECKVEGEKGDYYLIVTIDGKKGWALKERVSLLWPVL